MKLGSGIFNIIHDDYIAININKSLSLNGNFTGKDGRFRNGTYETVIKGGTANNVIIKISVGNVVLDGLKLTSDFNKLLERIYAINIHSNAEIKNVTIRNCIIEQLSSTNNVDIYGVLLDAFITGFTFEYNAF